MPKFELPPLPYAFNALEPHIDAMTMEIHHDRHHGTYVTNLNNALDKYPDLQSKTIEELISGIDSLPEDIRTAVRNNGGGHYNHSMFWQQLIPGGSDGSQGALADPINATFGSYTAFKEAFAKAATTRFGSGWAWLVADKSGALSITSTPNQDNPLMEGKTPILGLDVWEHAYYLKYQNKRPAYIEAFWNVVNWNDVAQRYQKISGK